MHHDQPLNLAPSQGRQGQNLRRIAFIYAPASAFLLVAVVLLFLRIAPYELLLKAARAVTGSGNPLSHSAYSQLLPRLLVGALFFGGLGMLLLAFQRKISSFLADVSPSLRRWVVAHSRSFKAVLHAETKWHFACLGFITAAGAVLRIIYVHEPPRYDETFTYLAFSSRSLLRVFAYYPAPNNHILNSALIWLSSRLFGNSLLSLRLPVLITGIVLIPLAYLTARHLGGRVAALWAAGLIATSGPFVLFSVNARGYMLQAALMLILLFLASELIDCYSDVRSQAVAETSALWFLFSTAALLGFWIAPTMLYSYLILFGWLLWACGWRVLKPLLIWGIITALAVVTVYMPVVMVSGSDALLRNPWVRPLPLPEFREAAVRFPSDLYAFLHAGDPTVFAIFVAAGVLFSLFWGFRNGSRFAHPFPILLLVLLLVPLAQRIVPFPRVILPIFIVYYLASAVGWGHVTSGKWFSRHEPAELIAFAVLFGFLTVHMARAGYLESNRDFADSPAVAAYLASHMQVCDRYVLSVSAGPVSWEMNYLKMLDREYDPNKPATGHLFVVLEKGDEGRKRGNGLLNPSDLTFEGTLSAEGLNSRDYGPPQLVFSSGRGEVFELTPIQASGNVAHTCQSP